MISIFSIETIRMIVCDHHYGLLWQTDADFFLGLTFAFAPDCAAQSSTAGQQIAAKKRTLSAH